MGFGDFARYVIGTNGGGFPWTSQLLSEPTRPLGRQRYKDFVAQLTERQATALSRFGRFLQEQAMAALISRQSNDAPRVSERAAETQSRLRRLRGVLGKKKSAQFDSDVLPQLEAPGQREFAFDLSQIQRWIIWRVHELGWSTERFGSFDRRIDRGYSREANKPERIGKKYQWIAYYEILARVADNFRFLDRDFIDDREGIYLGPWQLTYVRNIDPSDVTGVAAKKDPSATAWLQRSDEPRWHDIQGDADWLAEDADLPSPLPLIELARPDGTQWLRLHTFRKWAEPRPEDDSSLRPVGREIWYIVDAFAVKQSDLDDLLTDVSTADFTRGWHNEQREMHNLFFGELYWSEGYRRGADGGRNVYEWATGNETWFSVPAVSLSESFMWESSYDCSVEATSHRDVPSAYLAERMGLRWSGKHFEFADASGTVVAYDPMTSENGTAGLLVQQAALESFLAREGLVAVWRLRGKRTLSEVVIGRNPS